MSRIVFYRITIITLLISSFLSAELLKPTAGGEEKEILKIAGKRRIYTVLDDEEIVYQVHGPARIKLISRYPAPKKTKKASRFHILLRLMMKNLYRSIIVINCNDPFVQFSIQIIIIPIPVNIISMWGMATIH